MPAIARPDPLVPSPAEESMVDIHRVVGDRVFEDMDEANAFISEVVEGGLPKALPSTPLERAQQLVYRAVDADSGKEQVKLAKQALRESEDCADAYILLALESESPEERLDLFRRALEAGERVLEDTEYEEFLPNLWGFLPARPYLRALFGLGLMEFTRGSRLAGIEHVQTLLSINEADPQAARYYLLSWLLDVDDTVLARELVDRYEGGGGTWLWGKVLLRFKEGGDPGTPLDEALERHPLFPLLFLGPDDEEDPFDIQSKTSESDAYLARAWTRDVGAVWYLEDELAERGLTAGDEMAELGFTAGDEMDEWDLDRIFAETELETLDPTPGPHSGLSPDDVTRLLDAPVGAPGAAVGLDGDLSLEELGGSFILHNARLVLEKASGAGVRKTAKGNLNRTFVRETAAEMRLPPDELPRHEPDSLAGEESLPPLQDVRILLTWTGLLDEKKTVFAVSSLGRELLRPEAAGRLQALLFRTYFTDPEFAEAIGRNWEEYLWDGLPYSLWMLARRAKEWRSHEDLCPEIVFPEVAELLGLERTPDAIAWPIRFRIIDPLEEFGLLESRPDPARAHERFGGLYRQVRLTPLFHRFVRFEGVGG